MISIYYSKKRTPYVWASDLHKLLEIGTPLATWFPRMIEYGFEENTDYSRHDKFVDSAGSIKKAVFDWAVQIDMAKHIAMIQRSDQGKAMRDYLLSLDKKVEAGHLLSQPQLEALFEICKVIGFFSMQKFFEQKHFIIRDQPKDWWEYRAKLFGYNKSDLKEQVEAIGKKYVNQRQAHMALDKYELIRITTMDMFLAMGKSVEFAKNVAQFAKSIAQQIKPEIYNDEGISINFKSAIQKATIYDLTEIEKRSYLLDTF